MCLRKNGTKDNWEGPYVVIGKESKNDYVLKKEKEIINAHVSQLSKPLNTKEEDSGWGTQEEIEQLEQETIE